MEYVCYANILTHDIFYGLLFNKGAIRDSWFLVSPRISKQPASPEQRMYSTDPGSPADPFRHAGAARVMLHR